MTQLTIQPINFFSGCIELDDKARARLIFQVTLSCGCPTCAGGRFDPQRFKVEVSVYKKASNIGVFGAKYTGQASQFMCDVVGLSKGRYFIEINALDPDTGSAGRLGMELRLI